MAFDLNLSNYRNADLRALFKLPDTFNDGDLAGCEQAIRVQLLTEDLPEDLKFDLDRFLTDAAARLKRDLIPRPEIPFTPTRVEEYTRGTVNPYDKRTFDRVLSFDTLYRTNYVATASNDLLCTLPDPVRNTIALELVGIDLPCHYHPTFSAQTLTNSFTLTATYNVGASPVTDTYTVTIADGDYDPAEFEQVANKALVAAGADFMLFVVDQGKVYLRAKFIGEPGTYYDPEIFDDYKPTLVVAVTFTANGAGAMMGFSLLSYTADNFYQVFDADAPTKNLLATYRNYIPAEGFLINRACHYLYVEVDDYHNNFQTNTITSNRPTFNTNNVLARLAVRHGKIKIHHARREYLGPVRIEKMTLRLLDQHGAPVTWVRDYALALKFTLLYS
jgi:hypothetical protein